MGGIFMPVLPFDSLSQIAAVGLQAYAHFFRDLFFVLSI